jgi:hypothetical protein
MISLDKFSFPIGSTVVREDGWQGIVKSLPYTHDYLGTVIDVRLFQDGFRDIEDTPESPYYIFYPED